MSETTDDPIAHAAKLICPDAPDALHRRLKKDIMASIKRIKPNIVEGVDFDTDVMTGSFFTTLSPPLQGIAIARCEGTLAFYNRVGWHPAYLETALETCVPDAGIETLTSRYHAKHLHDLAYVHPKHFEKMLGKTEAASLWEDLKRFSAALNDPNKH